MNKTLSKSKNKKIVGGNNFTFDVPSFDDNINKTEFQAMKGNKTVKLIFYKKKNEDPKLNIKIDDIIYNINLKIITSNITEVKYYEPNMDQRNSNLPKDNIVKDMNNFDTCVIVLFDNICYIFLYVYTSGNGAIKEFDKNSEKNNLKVLDALTKANFKELGLDIKFVNKFVAVVNGYVDGNRSNNAANVGGRSPESLKDSDSVTSSSSDLPELVQAPGSGAPGFGAFGLSRKGGGSRKKINNYKILNNLIFILSKINKVKNLTKPKATKPTKPKATKPTKPKATKPTKPKATKPTKPKPTKPKPTKPKPTKPKPTKPTKPKPKVTKPTKPKPKVTKPKATKKI